MSGRGPELQGTWCRCTVCSACSAPLSRRTPDCQCSYLAGSPMCTSVNHAGASQQADHMPAACPIPCPRCWDDWGTAGYEPPAAEVKSERPSTPAVTTEAPARGRKRARSQSEPRQALPTRVTRQRCKEGSAASQGAEPGDAALPEEALTALLGKPVCLLAVCEDARAASAGCRATLPLQCRG